MKLIICEKPKVAEKIASALADTVVERKVANSIAYYTTEHKGEQITVVPAVGHIYSLHEKTKSSGYPVFDIEWAPAYEVEKEAEYTRGYVKNIAELAKKADELIAACDYDIEGSLIGYNAIRFAAKAKTGKRMKFSALTPTDLVEAFETRGPLDVQNALAGEARHFLDWFYGINLSRALMGAIRSRGMYKVMSIGRVQGPALGILAEREKEIMAFKPVPYWVLGAKCKEVGFMHVPERFDSKEGATKAMAGSSKDGSVKKIEKRQYEQNPYPPFDLTSLQVEAYKQFGFAPKQTLDLAQTLYEGSLISYPRTSSQKLPAKLNLAKVLAELAKNPSYSEKAGKLLAENRTTPFEGKKEDPAHPAIHPTGLANSGLGERERKLYDLIVKRFLACFARNAKRESQKVELLSGTETYATSGNRTVEQGWFEYYAPYLKLEEVTLPPFAEAEKVQMTGFRIEEKKTQPPKRFTEASLVSELEDRDLGTKATRAVVVETLFKRGYLKGKSIHTTPFGLAVYDALKKDAPEIMDEELTRSIEHEMDQISEGKIDEKKVIEDGKKVVEKIVQDMKLKEREIGFELAAGFKQKENEASMLGKCAKCGNELRMIKSRFGKNFVGCSGYPECRTTFPLPGGALIEPQGTICEKCKTPMIKVIRKGRKPFIMCLDPTCETKKGWAKPNYVKKPVEIAGANAPSALGVAPSVSPAPPKAASQAPPSGAFSAVSKEAAPAPKAEITAPAKKPAETKPKRARKKSAKPAASDEQKPKA